MPAMPARRRLALLPLAALFAWLPLQVAQAAPWQELFTGKQKPTRWDDPAGRFGIDLPRGWQGPSLEEDAPPVGPVVQFMRTLGSPAALLVDTRNLPPRATLVHFASQIEAEAERSAPGYRRVWQKRTRVGGLPAIERRFTYRDRNNAQLMKDVTQLVLIQDHRGFVLSFICPLGQYPALATELKLLKGGFSLGGAPAQVGPEGRIRLKAGQVVNPKSLRY